MLLRQQRLQRQLLSGFERRQLMLQFLVFLILIIFRFFVHLEEASNFITEPVTRNQNTSVPDFASISTEV